MLVIRQITEIYKKMLHTFTFLKRNQKGIIKVLFNSLFPLLFFEVLTSNFKIIQKHKNQMKNYRSNLQKMMNLIEELTLHIN